MTKKSKRPSKGAFFVRENQYSESEEGGSSIFELYQELIDEGFSHKEAVSEISREKGIPTGTIEWIIKGNH